MSALRDARRPIGVFDSGVGGLTVLRAIRAALPWEDLLYVADSAHAPYGDKIPEQIQARALAVTDFLIDRGAKAVVVACNTATGVAARLLRARHALPIVALEPAVKPALAHTRTGVIGVLATRRTLDSAAFARLLERFGAGARILPQPCPGLVERIEAGDLDGPRTRDLLASYVLPLLERAADTLVLGCTHYPHLRPLLTELAGPEVVILDSGAAVARQLQRRLGDDDLLAPPGSPGRDRFWTSGDPVAAQALFDRLWGAPTDPRALGVAAAHQTHPGEVHPGHHDIQDRIAADPRIRFADEGQILVGMAED